MADPISVLAAFSYRESNNTIARELRELLGELLTQVDLLRTLGHDHMKLTMIEQLVVDRLEVRPENPARSKGGKWSDIIGGAA